MESNNKNSNSGEGQQQLRRSAWKCKLNELANDGQPKKNKHQQPAKDCSRKKNRKDGNNGDLELESLSRDDLIKMVRMQMVEKNESQKQLETTKKEAEESAEQITEFSQPMLQLDQEKAEVHEDLAKKIAKIVELHKEVEEKSKMVVEKEEQCNALLIQLIESKQNPVGLPMPSHEMKIQLPLENWFDSLTFVSRHQLGKIVPKIGDRKFAFILQKFLHEYNQISLGIIDIVPPYDEHPSDECPRVRAWQWQKLRQMRFKMADSQMPANIKNFDMLALSYFDISVCNFMQKFQQNGLLNNVFLSISKLSKDIYQPVLTHLLHLLNGIISVECDSSQLVDIYDNVGNNQEVVELYMKMMKKTRFLEAGYDAINLEPDKIDLYCRWLYQTPRADGKPRVLLIGRENSDSAPISLLIDRIKQNFLMATDRITFFIRINLPEATFQPEEEHIFIHQNDKTKEKLMTTMEKAQAPDPGEWDEVVLLISRHPLGSAKAWIGEKVTEVLDCDFIGMNRTILLDEEMKIVM